MVYFVFLFEVLFMFLTEVMYFVFLGEVSPSRPLSPSHGPPHHISLTWPRYQQESCAQPLDLYFSTFLYKLVLMSESYFFYRLLTGELRNYCSKLGKTSIEKKRFLSGIARMMGGVYPCPNFLALFQEVHFGSIKRVYFFKNANVLNF